MQAPQLEREVPTQASLEKRRKRLNFQLICLTGLNLLLLVMWAGLFSSKGAHLLVVLCLTALTVTTWFALIITLLRRTSM